MAIKPAISLKVLFSQIFKDVCKSKYSTRIQYVQEDTTWNIVRDSEYWNNGMVMVTDKKVAILIPKDDMIFNFDNIEAIPLSSKPIDKIVADYNSDKMTEIKFNCVKIMDTYGTKNDKVAVFDCDKRMIPVHIRMENIKYFNIDICRFYMLIDPYIRLSPVVITNVNNELLGIVMPMCI